MFIVDIVAMCFLALCTITAIVWILLWLKSEPFIQDEDVDPDDWKGNL